MFKWAPTFESTLQLQRKLNVTEPCSVDKRCTPIHELITEWD